MKLLRFTSLLLLFSIKVFSQNTAISDVSYTPAASAMLDVYSTSKGMLVPRVTLAQKTAIASPATGLLVYQTNSTPGFYYYDGTAWVMIANTGNAWVPGGNPVSSEQTIGTTSNYDLPFITNNIEKMRLTTSGSLGLGSTSFNALNPEKLLVDYGTTTSSTLATFRGRIDNYLQINVQNTSDGVDASSDFVATADNGTDSTNYIDMGINSSNYAPSVDNFGGANDGYLFTNGRHLVIGTASSNSDLVFLVNGGQLSVNQAMRIDGTSKNIIIGRKDNSNAPVGNTMRGPNGLGTNISGGSLTLVGGNATGTATGGALNLNGGSTVSGTSGAVNINASINNAVNIGTGTNTKNVTIGGASNSILIPKSTVMGGVYYNSTAGGQLANASTLVWDNTNSRLGVNNPSPNSTFSVTGSHTVSYVAVSTNYTVLATDYVIINTGAAVTWTLPTPSTCPGRVYYLSNQGTGTVTLSPGIKRSNSATLDTSLGSSASTNTEEVMSDGTYWRQISN